MSDTDPDVLGDSALTRLGELLSACPAVPLGPLEAEFFTESWSRARLMAEQSAKLRIAPLTSGPAPTTFSFEFDCRYKRRLAPDQPVELVDDVLSGRVIYRPDVFDGDPSTPVTMVLINRRHGFWHPNYSRRHGILCVGDLPPGAIPLDDLLLHIYTIISYQNRSTQDPADLAAAAWFANEPDALLGLENVEPLFGAGGEA